MAGHDPKPCSSTSLETEVPSAVPDQENDHPDDFTAVMSEVTDTLSATTVPLVTGGQSTTPVTPFNFSAAAANTPRECMRCEVLKNSLRKYQKENSRLKRAHLKSRTELKSVGHVYHFHYNYYFGVFVA